MAHHVVPIHVSMTVNVSKIAEATIHVYAPPATLEPIAKMRSAHIHFVSIHLVWITERVVFRRIHRASNVNVCRDLRAPVVKSIRMIVSRNHVRMVVTASTRAVALNAIAVVQGITVKCVKVMWTNAQIRIFVWTEAFAMIRTAAISVNVHRIIMVSIANDWWIISTNEVCSAQKTAFRTRSVWVGSVVRWIQIQIRPYAKHQSQWHWTTVNAWMVARVRQIVLHVFVRPVLWDTNANMTSMNVHSRRAHASMVFVLIKLDRSSAIVPRVS